MVIIIIVNVFVIIILMLFSLLLFIIITTVTSYCLFTICHSAHQTLNINNSYFIFIPLYSHSIDHDRQMSFHSKSLT